MDNQLPAKPSDDEPFKPTAEQLAKLNAQRNMQEKFLLNPKQPPHFHRGRPKGSKNGSGVSFALLDMSAGSKMLKRMALSWTGRYKYDNIENLPPVEIDCEGYPIRPNAVTHKRRARFTESERQVRFLLMYNFTGGNVTLSCMEAGCTYKVYLEWAENKMFRQRIRDMNREIGDRLHIRLAQRTGLMRQPKGGLKVNDSALIGLLRKYKPDFMDDLEPDEPKPEGPVSDKSDETDIPRPPRQA